MQKSNFGMYLTLAVLGTLAGCATSPANVKATESSAVQTALDRARTDMGCLQPTGKIVARGQEVPAVGSGGWVNNTGPQAKYTVHVTGCGKSNNYTVYCPQQGGNCTAPDVAQPIAP